MRIGFFTDTYLPVSNGICYVIDIIRKDLEAAGHEVYVFAPQNMFKKPPKQKRVIRYNAIQGLLYSDQFFSFFWPPSEVEKVRKLQLEVIYIFTPSLLGNLGARVAKKLDIPYVIQYGTDLEAYAEDYRLATTLGTLGSSLLAPYFLSLGIKKTIRLYRSVFRRPKHLSYYSYSIRAMLGPMHEQACRVVATSEKTAAQLRRWPVEQHVVTIPTGVDAIRENPAATKKFKKIFGTEDQDQIILYAGRLSVEKNIETLIDAFELVAQVNSRAKLLIAGDFQYRKHLEKLAGQTACSDRIIFTGQVPRADMGSIYALADVFAFPSLTDCQALVLNEAAHAGLPLVWCDEPELNPVLQNDVSGLAAKNSAKDLAAKLNQLLNDETRRLKYGQSAKKLAAQYSETAQTKKIEKLLRQVTKQD